MLTQVRLLGDLDLGALRQQHPDGNLQSPPGWIQDTDRPILALRSAKNLQGNTLKRMEGVEDLNMIRAQGIVGVGATIRTPISLSPAAASLPSLPRRRPGASTGSPADPVSSSPFGSSPVSSVACSSKG
jgi:hypothetical protein